MGTAKETQLKNCVMMFVWLKDAGESVVAAVDEAVKIYEGYIVRQPGRIIQAVFGVPTMHEEDPERAIRAALLIRQRLGAGGIKDLSFAIGIHMGKVFTGAVGPETGRQYLVMGETVNLAARIMERARETDILVSDAVYQITYPVFEFTEPIRFLPPGYPDVIITYGVQRLKTGFIKRRGIEGLRSPIVGRQKELNQLYSVIEELFRGRGRTVILTGEAGVGKSRLIEEIFTYSLGLSLERGKSVIWCTGQCSPYRESLYLPFGEIIKQIAGIQNEDSEKTLVAKLLAAVERLAPDNPDETFAFIAGLFNIAPDLSRENRLKQLDPKAIKLQTQMAITTILKNYARTGPVVYCIDDLYLADDPTLECVKFITKTVPDLSALLILISRPEKEKLWWPIRTAILESPNAVELTIRRLTPEDIRSICRNLLKIPKMSESIVNIIVSKAEGNPFYLEELIKLFISRGLLVRKGMEWHATGKNIKFDIPYNIEGVIRVRFDTLPAGLKGLLNEMAVIGRNFSIRILKTLTANWESFDQDVARLVDLGFVVSENGEDYSFHHGVVREVIYSGIADKKLKEAHEKVAQGLEKIYADRLPEFNELLFEHYNLTDRVDKATAYGIKSGDTARMRYANQEATDYYNAVLNKWALTNCLEADPKQRRAVLVNLGKVLSRIGQSQKAFPCFTEALSLTQAPREEAEIYCLIADTYQEISDYDQALETYRKAESRLADRPEGEKIDIRIGNAWIHYLRGDYEKARVILENTVRLIPDPTTTEARQHLARCYNILGSLYNQTGHNQESFDSYQKALRIFELLEDVAGQGVIYNNITTYFTRQGDYIQALAYLNKSHMIDLKTGNLLSLAIGTYNIGHTLSELGDLENAEAKYREYLALNDRINNQLGNGYGNWGLGNIFMAKNDLSRAVEHLSMARDIFQRLGGKTLELGVAISQADLTRRQGNFPRALEAAVQAEKSARETGDRAFVFDALMIQAKTKIDQGLKEKKFLVMHLRNARELIKSCEQMVAAVDPGRETLFELHFNQSRIAYYLGSTQETLDYYGRAKKILDGILTFLPTPADRDRFLNQAIYRDFRAFVRDAGLKK
jgi:tetratricopeptide (TPR) repeat protein